MISRESAAGRRQAKALALDYRMGPENSLSGGLVDDACAAYRWLVAQEIQGPDEIVIFGRLPPAAV